MPIVTVITVTALIVTVLYATNAACAHQRGSKRDAMRAVSATAIGMLLFAALLQGLSESRAVSLVRPVYEVAILLCCASLATAVGLLKRSMNHCDKRINRP